MRHRPLIYLLSLLVISGSALPGRPLRAESPPPSASRLSVAADAQATPAATARFDFGSRSVLDADPITHTFVLRSQSDKPLTVDRLQPSCRCTTAVVEGVPDEATPFTLAPGQTARIRVIISPGDALPGPFEKEVYVFAGGESTPTATLQMAGKLSAPVTIQPQEIAFGRVRAKEAPPQTITVTVDNRLVTTSGAIGLRSNNPYLQIARLPSQKNAVPAGSTTLTYQITLSPKTPPGVFHTTLFVPAAETTAVVTGEVLKAR